MAKKELTFSLPSHFGDSSFSDMQQRMVGEMSERLTKKKDAVITQRLVELGIQIDMNAERNRRFKNFVIERNDTKETYWYNDGSETGLRIVTFTMPMPDLDISKPHIALNVEINYH